MSSYYDGWPPYVPVAKRREQAAKQVAKMKKKGMNILPIVIESRTIAKTFWGKSWCDNLKAYSDFENRLPRGRTYVRNGSVVHLDIGKGEINALVSGSSMYDVNITINGIAKEKWKKVVTNCAGSIGSLVELLQGKFSKSVMEIISHKDQGLFPSPLEMKVKCNCFDDAKMCKHIAAVLYGIGARLDSQPELLFTLRQADHFELLNSATVSSNLDKSGGAQEEIDTSELSAIFGIDIDESANIKVAKKPQKLKGTDNLQVITKRKPKKRQRGS
ncbi:MAG: SWIM zinc finger family protein [Candidatus Paracaedibacter sp.]